MRTLVDDDLPAGQHRITLNAEGLASGVYWYRLDAGPFSDTRKLVLVK